MIETLQQGNAFTTEMRDRYYSIVNANIQELLDADTANERPKYSPRASDSHFPLCLIVDGVSQREGSCNAVHTKDKSVGTGRVESSKREMGVETFFWF